MRKRRSYVGQRFGRLVALSDAEPFISPLGTKDRALLFRCDCGREKRMRANNVVHGSAKSCGCLIVAANKSAEKRALVSRSTLRHGATANGRKTGEYSTWQGMLDRCYRPAARFYHCYGGRGITVCDRWRHDFAAFLADMGPRPKGHSLERIALDGNYEPSNCRWATSAEQQRNTSRNRFLEIRGERLTVKDWAARSGLSYSYVRQRLAKGWSAEDAVFTPRQNVGRWRKK